MCVEKIPLRTVLEHLKSKHNAFNIRSSAGKASIFWLFGEEALSPGNFTSQLGIFAFEGNTFLIMCVVEKGIWKNRVMMVGSKEDANKFGIEINIPSKDASRRSKFNVELNFKGKIHSIVEDKQQVKLDDEGVLDFTNSMAKNMLKPGPVLFTLGGPS